MTALIQDPIQATWLDFFKRLSVIDRSPKISRSERPEHALDTTEV